MEADRKNVSLAPHQAGGTRQETKGRTPAASVFMHCDWLHTVSVVAKKPSTSSSSRVRRIGGRLRQMRLP